MTTQTWMITGANRGLGRALTRLALEAGHSVIATVRGEHSLTAHERLVVHRLDVRDRDGARAAVDRAVEHFGHLDVLVNNAGYGLVGAIEELGEQDAREIIETNLLGPLWLAQAALRPMRIRGSGQIVQISTVGAVGTMPTLGAYNASKWGLEGFSEALAAEARDFGIRVTIAELGGVGTEWRRAACGSPRPIPRTTKSALSCSARPRCPGPVSTARAVVLPSRRPQRQSCATSRTRRTSGFGSSSVTTRRSRYGLPLRLARMTIGETGDTSRWSVHSVDLVLSAGGGVLREHRALHDLDDFARDEATTP
ncbi:SDR family NAD(P)-dependent oxidoreductase [Allosaccharopolyspora coralli]|uniref:SDR family NAD(P)-dependent oxidoreductase n=1 Tax=Allosaccharopolyspora coralli TaxID=2665642 RepID=UPI001C9E5730|nr:SDR family NAD(P)-dependent oxidoreductase [Allosaccharopolyspora coralli]